MGGRTACLHVTDTWHHHPAGLHIDTTQVPAEDNLGGKGLVGILGTEGRGKVGSCQTQHVSFAELGRETGIHPSLSLRGEGGPLHVGPGRKLTAWGLKDDIFQSQTCGVQFYLATEALQLKSAPCLLGLQGGQCGAKVQGFKVKVALGKVDGEVMETEMIDIESLLTRGIVHVIGDGIGLQEQFLQGQLIAPQVKTAVRQGHGSYARTHGERVKSRTEGHPCVGKADLVKVQRPWQRSTGCGVHEGGISQGNINITTIQMG